MRAHSETSNRQRRPVVLSLRNCPAPVSLNRVMAYIPPLPAVVPDTALHDRVRLFLRGL